MTNITPTVRVERRIRQLRDADPHIAKAVETVSRIAGKHEDPIRIRNVYVRRDTPSPSGSDRKQPNREDRPPATRLVTPRGSLLRFSLLTLLEAQTQTPAGDRPKNRRNLLSSGGSDLGWLDLLPSITRVNKPDNRFSSVRPEEKMLNQLQSSIDNLASPQNELLRLAPRHGRQKHAGFELLHEGGRRATGDNVPYTVPRAGDGDTFDIPITLFTNGWVYALTESELAFLLVCAYQQSRKGPDGWFRMTGDERIHYHGLGPDAFDRHQFLSSMGLLEVEPHLSRGAGGQVFKYKSPDPSTGGRRSKKGLIPHALKFLASGFEKPAVHTVLDALE